MFSQMGNPGVQVYDTGTHTHTILMELQDVCLVYYIQLSVGQYAQEIY